MDRLAALEPATDGALQAAARRWKRAQGCGRRLRSQAADLRQRGRRPRHAMGGPHDRPLNFRRARQSNHAPVPSSFVSWFDRRGPFLRPDLLQSVTLRADVVKDGRRALLKARSVAARPLLDDGERGVTLQPVGGRALILVQLDSCYESDRL